MARQRQRQPDFITMILTELGKGVWFLVSWPWRKLRPARSGRLNTGLYTERWHSIRQLADAGDEQHVKQALLEADKLLDHAMKELGRSGETFGERIRTFQSLWERDLYQGVWEAHKLRNQLAHEVGITFSKRQAEDALMGFYKGLRKLGAL